MSVAPEAFAWLSKQAIERWGRMPKSERRVDEIAAWGDAGLRGWRDRRPDGGELSDAEVRSTARSVARFMVERYVQRRKRPPAKSSFESRALDRHAIRVVAEMMAEDAGKTVPARQVADTLGIGRSKVARALSVARGKPKREAVAATLSPTAQKLRSLVESVLPGDGERVVRIVELAERMWPKAGAEVKAGTARAQRKRLLDALATLAPLSIYAVADGEHVALIRGRRWTEKAAAARLATAAAKPTRAVVAVPMPIVGGPFWTSLEVRCLVAVLWASGGSPLYGYKFRDFISLQTPLRDTRPVTRAYQRAVSDADGGASRFPDFVRRILSDRAPRPWRFEPEARRTLIAAAEAMEWIYEDGRYCRPAADTIDRACREFSGLREPATPERRARIEAFKEIIGVRDGRDGWLDWSGVLALCERLARDEAAGRWSARPYLDPDCPF
ncbi:hypothetical protein [Aureimonas sp. AU40]|uniref:hypothetical protein n=1 Tax=Aureimonas sp. AU40 TaxID=1637747 RepID=UPI0007845C8A|nr:hypothetical protein [Aureimonas sp. AU40]